MKVAFVGKGGSGKSTMSWLFTKWLASQHKKVLAIDADHNMDLTSLLQYNFQTSTPTIHKNHDVFRATVGLEEDKNWSRIVLEKDTLTSFSLDPMDTYTQQTSVVVDEYVRLMIVGLGSDDVLYSARCAHGHSAPLKYYLPLLQEKGATVIIDGVAGADMLHFGLFCGADVIVVAVESHQNSVKVAEQIAHVADRIHIPVRFILNKKIDTPFIAQFIEKYSDRIVGEMQHDAGIASYEFGNVSESVLKECKSVWNKLELIPKENTLDRLRNFEQEKKNRKEVEG